MNDRPDLQIDPFKTPFDDIDHDEHSSHASHIHSHCDTKAWSGHGGWEDRGNECDEEFSHSHDKQADRRAEYLPTPKIIEEVTDTLTNSQSSAFLALTSNMAKKPLIFNGQAGSSKMPIHSEPSQPKSRTRRKAHNANAGIHLVTDMSKLQKQPQVLQEQQAPATKFFDRAALLALEGSPSDPSTGNCNMRTRYVGSNSNGSCKHVKAASPAGLNIKADVASSTLPWHILHSVHSSAQLHTKSVWSPDTDEGSPHDAGTSTSHAAYNIYSRTGPSVSAQPIPPPPGFSVAGSNTSVETINLTEACSNKPAGQNSLFLRDVDDADAETPITLFEEDGSPAVYGHPSRICKSRNLHARSRATIDTTYSGWWDHVRTPFEEQTPHSLSASKSPPLTPASSKTPISASSYCTKEPIPAVPSHPIVSAVPGSAPAQPQLGSLVTLLTATSPAHSVVKSQRENDTAVEKGALSFSNQQANRQAQKSALCISTTVASANLYPNDRPLTPACSSQAAAIAQGIITSSFPGMVQFNKDPKCLSLAHTALADHRKRGRPTSPEAPPPYEPSTRLGMDVSCRVTFPSNFPPRGNYPSSPEPLSPGLAYAMSSQGGIHMSEVPLTPLGVRGAAIFAGTSLPTRATGALLPGTTTLASVAAGKVERSRRRHEKEDGDARCVGTYWRGRGCLPTNGCLGRKSGREHRKRRRLVCMGVLCASIFVVTLASVLGVALSKKHIVPADTTSFWLNTTAFPAIPTGTMTILGIESVSDKPGCVSPTSLWSCSLPKEQQSASGQYSENQLPFFIDIQYDNNTQQLWNVPDGIIPIPTPSVVSKSVAAPVTRQFDPGFVPQPAPPTFQEMWFLGNTTDGIVSRRKAGEPTPFYVTFLSSVNATTASPNTVSQYGNTSVTAADGYPVPVLNPDGTGAPATVHPLPIQQPLRLYDRGLPTEHFGFYTYFSKTIYVQSIKPDTSPLASDVKGGSLQIDANYIVTWLQTRFLVQVWTRLENTTRLLGTQLSTFPYPVTVTEDLHGGDFLGKGVFARTMDSQQQIQMISTTPIIDNLRFGGLLVNHGTNPTYGGSDGGTGGCQCAWTNFIELNGSTAG
ncbi:hypothetical protein SEPCBS57363_002948 [Sporothrix epigloea]|uniref:Glycoprotease family protein n=1 Tax=Sporothrix epigloea TaxID=1892477 RepID=A0ABP0DKJ6_9PEZI